MNQFPTKEAQPAHRLSPWLASVLMKRGDFLPRFAFYRQRLARQSRGWRRRLRRQLAVSVTGAALLLAVAGARAQVEPAATDNVITVVNNEVAVANNGRCSLIEAIQNANNKQNGRPNTDCAAGNPNGADTINLPANGMFTLRIAQVSGGDPGPIGLPWLSTQITINGNGSTIQRDSNAGPFRIMAVGDNGNVTLNNTTLRGGQLLDSYDYYYEGGAGILNRGALTISGSTLVDHDAWLDYASGGAIANTGRLIIFGSIIEDNISKYSGGAIDNYDGGEVTIRDSLISGNVAGYEYGASGGAIWSNGQLTIVDSTLSDNYVYANYYLGSSAVAAHGVTSISGSTFVRNSAAYTFNYDYVTASAVSNTGDMTIANSTFSANYGSGDTTSSAVTNEGNLTITNSTFSRNEIGIIAICTPDDWSSMTRLQRTVVSGNNQGEVQLLGGDCWAELEANSHNLFGHSGNAGVTGFTPGPTDIVPSAGLNAILSPLANNGGPTQTHALPAGSPALDRAPNSSCTAAPVNGVDQRGQPRNQNGSGGASANECDVGAFERAGSAPPAAGGFYLSPGKAGTMGGVPFAPHDIIRFEPAGGWSMHFDGSDVGITKNVTGFELQDDGSILLSLGAAQAVPGIGSVAPHDVIRFVPSSTGTNTAGSFQMWVDGSTVGLTTTGEKVDALGLAADGRIAISTTGTIAVPKPGGGTLKAANEDALGFNRATSAWSVFFDPTSVTGMGGENVNGLWVNPSTGEVYVSFPNAFNLEGVTGDARDIVKLTPTGGGGYTPSLYWDGSAADFPVAIDALEMTP